MGQHVQMPPLVLGEDMPGTTGMSLPLFLPPGKQQKMAQEPGVHGRSSRLLASPRFSFDHYSHEGRGPAYEKISFSVFPNSSNFDFQIN